MRPGLSTHVMAAFLAMNWGDIEARVKAHYGTQDLILAIPSRDVTTEWLQRFLGMKEIYAKVTVWVTSEMSAQGHKPDLIIMDDLGAAQAWDIKTIFSKMQIDEPVIKPKFLGNSHQGVPQSKGERHANRRYRWC